MKQPLKVKMTTSSCLVYAETGRFPLCVFINMYMIKHWFKILNMNVKQLVHVAYREMFQHQEQQAWIRHIKDLLCYHGFGNIWNDQSVINEKVFLANFDQRLKDEFIQKCFSDIRDSDRCRLYKKMVFGCESNMNCNIRRDVRVCFTKLRLSSHTFLVERARWLKLSSIHTTHMYTLYFAGGI